MLKFRFGCTTSEFFLYHCTIKQINTHTHIMVQFLTRDVEELILLRENGKDILAYLYLQLETPFDGLDERFNVTAGHHCISYTDRGVGVQFSVRGVNKENLTRLKRDFLSFVKETYPKAITDKEISHHNKLGCLSEMGTIRFVGSGFTEGQAKDVLKKQVTHFTICMIKEAIEGKLNLKG